MGRTYKKKVSSRQVSPWPNILAKIETHLKFPNYKSSHPVVYQELLQASNIICMYFVTHDDQFAFSLASNSHNHTPSFAVRAYAPLTLPGCSEYWNARNFNEKLIKLKETDSCLATDFPNEEAQPPLSEISAGEKQATEPENKQQTEQERQKHEEESKRKEKAEKKKNANELKKNQLKKKKKEIEQAERDKEEESNRCETEETNLEREKDVTEQAEKNREEEKKRQDERKEKEAQARLQLQQEMAKLQQEREVLVRDSSMVQAAAAQVQQVAESQKREKRAAAEKENQDRFAAAERQRKEHADEKEDLERQEKELEEAQQELLRKGEELEEARRISLAEAATREVTERKRRDELAKALEASLQEQNRKSALQAPTSTCSVVPAKVIPDGQSVMKCTWSDVTYTLFDPTSFGKVSYSASGHVEGRDEYGGEVDVFIPLHDIVKSSSDNNYYVSLGWLAQPDLKTNNIVKQVMVKFHQG